MEKIDRFFKVLVFAIPIVTLIGLVSISIVFSNLLNSSKDGSKILGESDMNVKAIVGTCDFKVKVVPEDRVSGNYSTSLIMDITNSSNPSEKFTINTNSNNNGEASVNLCSLGITVTKGNYLFHVYGKSHLGRNYGEYETFKYVSDSLDLSASGKDLIAGECGNFRNNKINSLDMSGIIKRLGSTSGDGNYNDVYDLNLDGRIDEDDTQILIKNFYKLGE